MTRHPSFNTTIGWDAAGGTSYVTIGQVKDISGPSITRDTFEVTDRDVTGNYKEFWGGYSDGGELTFDINWDPLNEKTHGTAAGTAMLTNLEETDMCAAKAAWRVQMDLCGGTATWTFDGILSGFEMSSPENDVLGSSVSVKVSGKPTLVVS
jgi:hypothetical protein